jgi:hypothetical protein
MVDFIMWRFWIEDLLVRIGIIPRYRGCEYFDWKFNSSKGIVYAGIACRKYNKCENGKKCKISEESLQKEMVRKIDEIK